MGQIPPAQAVPQYPPNFFMPHPSGMNFGAMNRGPVPSSFVPMQVTRQCVQHHPKTQPAPMQPKHQPQQAQNVPDQLASHHPADKPLNPVVSENPVPGQLLTAKPPGSRLAIRFNGP